MDPRVQHPVPGRISARVPRWLAPATVALVAAGWCTTAAVLNPAAVGSALPSCPFKALTGWDCPGCGSTRMLHALVHGRPDDAAGYNVVALAALPLLIYAWFAWLLRATVGLRLPDWQTARWVAPAVLGVVVVWWVVRNIPVAPFVALHV